MASSSEIRRSDVEEFLKRRAISPEIRPPRHYFNIPYPFWVFQRLQVCPSVMSATLSRNVGPSNGGGAVADQPPSLPRVLQPVKKEELENLRTRLKVSTKEKDVGERPWKLRSNRSASEEKRSLVKKEKVKFNFALSKREIEEDFLKVLGRKPSSRPKKRPRKVQEEIDRLFPGTGIKEITVDAYKKPSNKGEQLVSSKLSAPDVNSDASIISPPIVGTVTGNEINSDNGVASKLQSEEVVLPNVKEGGSNAQAVICSMPTEDPERFRLEEAATKAQAAFRGYAARREFQTHKCIITLQAHARGHLVRRQAVSTLCCVKGIVKFQAIVRARKDAKVSAATKFSRLSKKAFVFKLRASLPTALPLRLQYGSEEPNSASLWLERWTGSYFWLPLSEPKKNPDSKSRRREQEKSKKSVRKMSGANVENGSACSTLDSEKGKRNQKKVSSHPVNSAHERSPIETEKLKRGSRKTPDPTKEVSDRLVVDNGKSKHKTRKPLGAAAPAISEQGANDSAEKLKDIPTASPKQSDLEKNMELHNADNSVDKLHCQSSLDMQPMDDTGKTEDVQGLNQQLGSKDDSMLNDNPKTSQRRASLPAKFDPHENGSQSTPKLPSYMAPTESAKARLRGQGSPRFSQDTVEKNVLLRRHSLSSSTNSILSSLSPRAHKLVQATGRGAIRGDRSLSSSRDGGDKLIQAEWRR